MYDERCNSSSNKEDNALFICFTMLLMMINIALFGFLSWQSYNKIVDRFTWHHEVIKDLENKHCIDRWSAYSDGFSDGYESASYLKKFELSGRIEKNVTHDNGKTEETEVLYVNESL